MQGEAGGPGRSRLLLLVAVIVALLIAAGASYGVVVSQNPKSSVPGPPTSYGPTT